MLTVLIGVGIAATALVLSSVRVLREYERAIVFRLGRAKQRPVGPGLILLLPVLDRMTKVDTRTKVIQIPPQEVITRDNISIAVDAVVYADVNSPADAVLRVESYLPATLQLAATMLRSVLGRMDMDEILAKRTEINDEIRMALDTRTEQWGVEITAVEIKDISLPQEMKRAMARQAEAERERRAKIIVSEGELQAAANLTQAAALIGTQPAALQLRTLQTLVEVSAERSNTIIFPIPIELLQHRSNGAREGSGEGSGDGSGAGPSLVEAIATSAAMSTALDRARTRKNEDFVERADGPAADISAADLGPATDDKTFAKIAKELLKQPRSGSIESPDRWKKPGK